MGVSLSLHAFDPSVVPPLAAARAGDAEPLRAWLRSWRHEPDPEEVEAREAQLARFELLEAPDILVEHERHLRDRAKRGPLAGLDLAAADAEQLVEAARATGWDLDLTKHWDVLHYGLDSARRLRESALHWRLRGERPTPYDLALFGHHPSPLRPPSADPEPEEVRASARSWEEAFRPYDGYENDAAQVAVVADALDLVSMSDFAQALARGLPAHVYGRGHPNDADWVQEYAREQRYRLAAFYRHAADRGLHVEARWST